jgi:hypothetical protein
VQGELKGNIGHRYPLADAAQAQHGFPPHHRFYPERCGGPFTR